jgi:hypothetical protein
MATKPVDRLLFAQGGLCFFCGTLLPKSTATVEHLLAASRGGGNGDENCVACCQTLNALFGNFSLKEKFRVVLNQNGHFKCPNGIGTPAKPKAPPAPSQDVVDAVIANLKSRGNARPRRLKTLASTIKSLASLKLTDAQVAALIQHLQSAGSIVVSAEQVSYAL